MGREQEATTLGVKLPNGCTLVPGGRIRMPREHIFRPEVMAAAEEYGWELEPRSSPSSEVIRWPALSPESNPEGE